MDQHIVERVQEVLPEDGGEQSVGEAHCGSLILKALLVLPGGNIEPEGHHMLQQQKDDLRELGAIELQHAALHPRLSHTHSVLQEGQLADVHGVGDVHEVGVQGLEDVGQEVGLEVVEQRPVSHVGHLAIEGGDALDESEVEVEAVVGIACHRVQEPVYEILVFVLVDQHSQAVAHEFADGVLDVALELVLAALEHSVGLIPPLQYRVDGGQQSLDVVLQVPHVLEQDGRNSKHDYFLRVLQQTIELLQRHPEDRMGQLQLGLELLLHKPSAYRSVYLVQRRLSEP